MSQSFVNLSTSRQQGFTLLEVVAAFAIFVLAFGLVLEIISTSLRTTTKAEQFTVAALHARSLMDQVGIEPPLEEGTEGGELEDGYRWQMEIYEAEPPQADNATTFDLPLVLYQVDLTVSWQGGGADEQSASFSTLRVAQRTNL